MAISGYTTSELPETSKIMMIRFRPTSRLWNTTANRMLGMSPVLCQPICRNPIYNARRPNEAMSVIVPNFISRLFSTTGESKEMASATSFHDLKADLPGGGTYDFSQLKGKVVLLVNVASAWWVVQAILPLDLAHAIHTSGFTPQYRGANSGDRNRECTHTHFYRSPKSL
jgi:hypothetical protein